MARTASARRVRPTRPHGADAAPFLVLALVSAVGVALVYLAAVRTELGQRIDESAFGSLSPDRNPNVFDATDDLLRTIDVSSVAILGVGIAVLAVVRGRIATAVAAAALVVGANVTTQILKVRLEREDLILDGIIQTESYPSGHVTVAMSLALALVLVASPATRALAAAAGGAYAAAVGIGVLLLNWHRPSDVLGAYLVCVAWFGLAAALASTVGRPSEPSRSRAGPWGVAIAGVTSAAFVSVTAWAVWRRFDVLTIVGDREEFVAAAIGVTAVAGASVAIATLLLRTNEPRSGTVPADARGSAHRRRGLSRAERGHQGRGAGRRDPVRP